ARSHVEHASAREARAELLKRARNERRRRVKPRAERATRFELEHDFGWVLRFVRLPRRADRDRFHQSKRSKMFFPLVAPSITDQLRNARPPRRVELRRRPFRVPAIVEARDGRR